MAEIEIGILDRQCLDRRQPDQATLITEVNACQLRRNMEQRGIEWSFTRQDADTKTRNNGKDSALRMASRSV